MATLSGHIGGVTACTVAPDGRYVVSASWDQTLKVWDLASYTCRFTHRGDTPYLAVAITATTVIAGDAAGVVWFLDLPRSLASSIDAPFAPGQPMTHATSPIAAHAPAAAPSPKVDIDIVTTELAPVARDAAKPSQATTQTASAPSGQDRPVGSRPAEGRRMTRDVLLPQLQRLLPSQFEAVVFRARVPVTYLPGAMASQTEGSIAVIRYLEQQNQLDQLARIVQQVAIGGG